MTPAPKRRWFQFSLRRLLFWDVIFIAVIALLLSYPRQPELPYDPYDPLELKREFHELFEDMSARMRIVGAVLVGVAWLVLPTIARSVWRITRKIMRRSDSNVAPLTVDSDPTFLHGSFPPTPGPTRVAAPAFQLSLKLRNCTTDNATPRHFSLGPRANPPGDAGLGWVDSRPFCLTTTRGSSILGKSPVTCPKRMLVQSIKSILVGCVLLAVFAAEAKAVTMNWSAVGNAGNANDPATGNLYGGVGYNYNIGTKDVTAGQYVEFLNAKDAGGLNQLRLYNSNMSSATFGGISFNNLNPAGSMYGVISGRGNHPANYTSWYDSIRFANWMNNGQGNGDTETGAYTLGTLGAGGVPVSPPLTHNAGSQIWLPTENEWYKAAYNTGSSSYFQYPTGSNTIPIASGPTALPNHANFSSGGPGNLTDVGAYGGTTSPYGAFDMAGNVFQWNEALISGSYRDLRGGGYGAPVSFSSSSFELGGNEPISENSGIGFRLASVPGVPEPSTLALAAFGFIGLALWRWRRKHA